MLSALQISEKRLRGFEFGQIKLTETELNKLAEILEIDPKAAGKHIKFGKASITTVDRELTLRHLHQSERARLEGGPSPI